MQSLESKSRASRNFDGRIQSKVVADALNEAVTGGEQLKVTNK